MNELNSKLENLKEYSKKKEIKRLDKKIYSLHLSKDFLKSVPEATLQYIHVRLHTALSYKKPFADIKEIRKVHDVVAKLMKNHCPTDPLDYPETIKKRQNI